MIGLDGKHFDLNEQTILLHIKEWMDLNPLWTEDFTRERVMNLNRRLFQWSLENNIEENINEYLDYYNVPKDLSMKERLAYYQLLKDNN